MKTILIDPGDRSVRYIELTGNDPEHLIEIHQIIGDDGLDFCRPFPTGRECVVVGDHSALQNPPLPHFIILGHPWPIYGKALVFGRDIKGATIETSLTVAELREWILFDEQ
jgi:hypothetical protein